MATFPAKVVGGTLNLRASCNTGSTRLAQIPNNTALTVETVSGQNAWFKTTYGNKTGYVLAKFVQITGGANSCTVKNAHTVRQTPSSSGSSSFSASANQSVYILDTTTATGWYRISSKTGSQGTGWSQTTDLNTGSSTTPDGYGIVKVNPYGQYYLYSDAGLLSVYCTVPANTTLPLWLISTNDDNIAIKTEYNYVTLYADIESLEIIEPNNDTLSQGSSGFGVIKYKKRLYDLGYHPYRFSQNFTGTLMASVKIFQQLNGLTADGIIGTNTRAQLNSSTAIAWSDANVTAWRNTMNGTTAPMQWYMNSPSSYWASFPWPHNSSGTETIGMDGNSITAMAMVLTTFANRAVTPVEMAEFTLDNEYRDPTGTSGVKNDFYTQIGNHYYEIYYEGQTTSLTQIQSHLANGGLAIATVTADANQTYTAGATQLVIYKITSDGVYVLSPNINKNPASPLAYSEWNNASWFVTAYLYTICWG